MKDAKEIKSKTSKYIIANGNGFAKQFLPLLKGKYGFLFAMVACVYALAYLSDEQIDRVLRFLPVINTPIGWGLLGIAGLIIIFQITVRPIIDTGANFFERYLEKEERHITIMAGIEKSIRDLDHILREEFVLLLKQLLTQSQKNYTGIKQIWAELQKKI